MNLSGCHAIFALLDPNLSLNIDVVFSLNVSILFIVLAACKSIKQSNLCGIACSYATSVV